jgi:hypothetical protein
MCEGDKFERELPIARQREESNLVSAPCGTALAQSSHPWLMYSHPAFARAPAGLRSFE